MSESIIKDKRYSYLLNQEGYFIYTHDNNSFQSEVLEIFKKYSPKPNFSNFHTTHFSENVQYKKDVFNLSKRVYEESFRKLFHNYEVLFANLMVKFPGDDGMMPVHADWTYVDESKHTAISIWIPMLDTANRNDALGVIPSSHELFDIHRGPNIISPTRMYNKKIMDRHGKSLYINQSQAVIYDLKLLHYSKPNLSKGVRVAINITIIPKNAEPIHYNKFNNQVHEYRNLDSNFFLGYHAQQIPSSVQPAKIFKTPKQVSKKDLLKRYDICDSSGLNFLQKINSYLYEKYFS